MAAAPDPLQDLAAEVQAFEGPKLALPVLTFEASDSLEKLTIVWIGVDKTKAMCFSKTPCNLPPLTLGDQYVQFVKQFKYLGQILSSNGLLNGEISQRVGKATYAFNQLLGRGI